MTFKKMRVLAASVCLGLTLSACGAAANKIEPAVTTTAEPTTTAEQTTAAPVTTTAAPETETEKATEPAPVPPAAPEVRPNLLVQYGYINDEEVPYYSRMQVSYDIVAPDKKDGDQLTALYSALEAKNEQLKKTYENIYEKWAGECFSRNKDVESYSDAVPFIVMGSSYVRRSDTKVLSVLEVRDSELGDEERSCTCSAINLDTVTGAEIKLEDVITDRAEFLQALGDRSEAQGIERKAMSDAFKARANLEREIVWTLDPQGITVWFDADEVDIFEVGPKSLTVLFSEIPELLTGKYSAASGIQTMSMPLSAGAVYDAGADGKPDQLIFVTTHDENAEGGYDSIKDLYIYAGEESCVEKEINAYNTRQVLLTTPGGKALLYIEYAFDNDYHNMGIYDVSGAPKKVEQREEHFENKEVDGLDVGKPLTNPEDYNLQARMDLLSTLDGTRHCHTGEDGLPVPESEVYQFSRDITIYARRSITVDLVDKETGEVTRKDIEIPLGESLKLARSDNKTFVDAVISTGNMVRVYVDRTNGWPMTVNGEDIYDCFDGMLFAG